VVGFEENGTHRYGRSSFKISQIPIELGKEILYTDIAPSFGGILPETA
jgi:hypothetical protein